MFDVDIIFKDNSISPKYFSKLEKSPRIINETHTLEVVEDGDYYCFPLENILEIHTEKYDIIN